MGSTMSPAGVHQYKIPKRTEGDGMEKEEITISVDKRSLSDQLIYRPIDLKESYLSATPVVGKVIDLTPKINFDGKQNQSIKTSKEPKFVPYEPYKAATNPIINRKKCSIKLHSSASPDIEGLLKLKNVTVGDLKVESSNSSKWEEEKHSMVKELNQLRKEKAELQNQVEYQTQVNAEIKKLLVAAVGEDIETRVQLLAEDKLHLAKRLINTANTLSSHHEQSELLAGQSEVWRSKFLSSSMLVEDLAKWKACLSRKVGKYEKSLKCLLDDNEEMRKNAFLTFINLSTLQEKFKLDVLPDEKNECSKLSMNLNDLCTSNHQLSELLFAQLLNSNEIAKNKFILDTETYLSASEKEALMVLSEPMLPLRDSDKACSAVMTGAAMALSSSSPHCTKCNGTVRTV